MADMLALGLIQCFEQVGTWIWCQTSKDIYDTKIKGVIPAFHLFFSRPTTKDGTRFTNEAKGTPDKKAQGVWTSGPMYSLETYINRCSIIKALTDNGGQVSSNLWVDEKGKSVNVRPEREKKAKSSKVNVKKPSEMSTQELTDLAKSIQSLLKAKKA